MNKKPESERKSFTFSFRVNSTDREMIEDLVKIFQNTKSDWFRYHFKEFINTLNNSKP
jgi:hypothetical protein